MWPASPLPRAKRPAPPVEKREVTNVIASPVAETPTFSQRVQATPLPEPQQQPPQAVVYEDSGSVARSYEPMQSIVAPQIAANIDTQELIVGQGRGVAALSQRPEVISAPTQAEVVDKPKRPKAPRREISMSSETLEMIDELIELIQEGSGQRDAKVNELMHALVALAYEVKEGIDAYSIPKRGRWGTPTARAFPYEIKNAIEKAILSRKGE